MYTYICIITSYLQTYAYSTSFKPMHPSCQCIFGTWLVAQYCWSCLNSLPWSAAFQPLFAWLYKSSYDMYIQQTTARFGPPVGLSADLLHWIGNRPSISAQDLNMCPKTYQVLLWSFLSSWWFQPPLTNCSQNGNLPQVGMIIKSIWNHQPDYLQIIHFIGVFHYKPSILGCFPIFGNLVILGHLPDCWAPFRSHAIRPSHVEGRQSRSIFRWPSHRVAQRPPEFGWQSKVTMLLRTSVRSKQSLFKHIRLLILGAVDHVIYIYIWKPLSIWICKSMYLYKDISYMHKYEYDWIWKGSSTHIKTTTSLQSTPRQLHSHLPLCSPHLSGRRPSEGGGRSRRPTRCSRKWERPRGSP